MLLVVTLLVIALCVAILAELMVSDRVRAGKYVNPYVASQVVSGTIYDRNGRALALDVPKNNVYVKTDLQNADTAPSECRCGITDYCTSHWNDSRRNPICHQKL